MAYGRVLITLVIVSLFFCFFLYTGASVLAQIRGGKVEKHWAEVQEPMSAMIKHFPVISKANESALILERLSTHIGIELSPSKTKRSKPGTNEAKNYEAIHESIGKFVNVQLETPDNSIQPLPESLQKFLTRKSPILNQIAEHLITQSVPYWELDIHQLTNAPMPNLKGYLRLQKLLILQYMSNVKSHNYTSAERFLDASWRFNQSLAKRPEIIAQLIRIATVRMQAGSLRKIEATTLPWEQRLSNQNQMDEFVRSLQMESWILIELSKRDLLFESNDNPYKTKLYSSLGRPFIRLGIIDHSIRLANEVRELKRRDICSPKKERTEKQIKEFFPKWNIIGRIAWVEPAGPWNRMASLTIDEHLTKLILRSKKHPSDSRMADFSSAPCKGLRWTVTSPAQGFLEFTPNEAIDWKPYQPKGLILPLSHTEVTNF